VEQGTRGPGTLRIPAPEVIIEHFRQKSAGKIDGRPKAMVVTRSRLHAVRTKQALDAYIAKKGNAAGDRPRSSRSPARLSTWRRPI